MLRIISIFVAVVFVLINAEVSTAQPRIFPLKNFKTDNWKAESDSDPLSDFAEKGLPEAAVIGENPSFEAGANAARRILKYDDDSLPLLIAALQKGGFHILDIKNKPLYLPRSGPGLDIGFYDFEVAGMLRGVGLAYGSSIEKLARAYAGDGSQMSSAEVARRMLVDLRAMKRSNDPHIQFNAGMLFEMSRLTPTNGDLATAPASAIKLNMIQAALIERILLLDLLTLFENLGGANSQFIPDPGINRRSSAAFVNASYSRPPYSMCEAMTDISSFKKNVKTGVKAVKTVKAFSELSKDIGKLEDIKNSQTVKGASIVNAALAWAKTIMAYLNVVATFELEQPMPLIREKRSNVSGDKRNTTIKVEMNFNNSEFINCVGTALGNFTDVGFSVPKNGPLAGVGVSWEVLLTSKRANTGFWASLIEGRDYEKFTSVPAFVDAADRGDISRQFTNNKGENAVVLTGKPQPYDMSKMAVVPLPKKVNLRAKIALDKIDAGKDIPKILKLGLGTAVDPLLVLEFVADLVAKIPLKTYEVSVPVRDWQPCSADWGGTISYKREHTQTIFDKGSRISNGNSTGAGFRQISKIDEATIQLNPRTKEEIEAKASRKPAQIYVRGKHSDVLSGKREADPCCGPIEGQYNINFKSGNEMVYSQMVTSPSDVRIAARERDFSIALGLTTSSFPATFREFLEIENSNCPIDTASANDEIKDGTYTLSALLQEGRYGDRYADETGEIMVGAVPITIDKFTKEIWQWELARCGK